jgi:hypothetical protein
MSTYLNRLVNRSLPSHPQTRAASLHPRLPALFEPAATVLTEHARPTEVAAPEGSMARDLDFREVFEEKIMKQPVEPGAPLHVKVESPGKTASRVAEPQKKRATEALPAAPVKPDELQEAPITSRRSALQGEGKTEFRTVPRKGIPEEKDETPTQPAARSSRTPVEILPTEQTTKANAAERGAEDHTRGEETPLTRVVRETLTPTSSPASLDETLAAASIPSLTPVPPAPPQPGSEGPSTSPNLPVETLDVVLRSGLPEAEPRRVRVEIGRVEVQFSRPEKKVPGRPRRSASRGPLVSLDAYLKQRSKDEHR